MEPLGNDYTSVLKDACYRNRWVDWVPNKGKRQGASSTIMVDGFSPYLSYDESMIAMSILAHELGHSMHSYLSYKNQIPIYNS